ncbi:MAG: chromophore lyase CpcT/CpeT [Pseudomonadota bacterium]
MTVIFFCSFVAALGVAGAAHAQSTPLEKDLGQFLSWFEGRYDNALQVFWEPQRDVPEADRHERIHSVFRRVDLPAFGENVFYVEQYLDGDPTKIYRQRIYAFTADETEAAIRLKIYTPKDPARLVGAYRDPQALSRLRVRDATTREGCDVFWTKRANQFVGYMKDGACRFVSERSGQEIVISDDLVLTEDAIWIADRAETADGAYVFGNRAGVPHKLRKIRPFACWTAVLPGARHGESGEGRRDWDFKRGGWLHDQNGVLAVSDPSDPARQIRLRMRRVEWPSGPNRPSLTLYLEEGESTRAVSYAWTDYDGERIGLNTRWLQASCTHAPERVFDDGRVIDNGR